MYRRVVEAAWSEDSAQILSALKDLDTTACSESELEKLASVCLAAADQEHAVYKILTATATYTYNISPRHLTFINQSRDKVKERCFELRQRISDIFGEQVVETGLGPEKMNVFCLMEKLESELSGMEAGKLEASVPNASPHLLKDLEAAAKVIDLKLVPWSLPVILGKVENYHPKEFDEVVDESQGQSRRIFVHYGMVFARRLGTDVDSCTIGSLVHDVMDGMNNNGKECGLTFAVSYTYPNRLGGGALIHVVSSGGVYSIRERLPDKSGRLANVVIFGMSYDNESLLLFLAEAAVFLGADTGHQYFIGIRIMGQHRFHMKIFVLGKTAAPKSAEDFALTAPVDPHMASSMVAGKLVNQQALENYSDAELGELFDVVVVRTMEAAETNYKESDRFVMDLSLKLSATVTKMCKLDLSDTVECAYHVWLHDRNQSQNNQSNRKGGDVEDESHEEEE
ncbi:uncharacterized protein LOC129599315 [Paramacrobiotus metropolitanus]|uniref:uncharacterized protein LOC129599315 n=1 Tax=Paramacrobiotus metropolitanus TaxID=2943436 RepID=UPI0024460837|nr:uncharacterized protein LOC129599315 [Paramacrobiotus metropolitanus]XP_055353503.1 uncharacterized protein LOC129599315 [Paramacrobiotus metropolitanus]